MGSNSLTTHQHILLLTEALLTLIVYLTITLLMHRTTQMRECALRSGLTAAVPPHIFLAIHNIDAEQLRDRRSQEVGNCHDASPYNWTLSYLSLYLTHCVVMLHLIIIRPWEWWLNTQGFILLQQLTMLMLPYYGMTNSVGQDFSVGSGNMPLHTVDTMRR